MTEWIVAWNQDLRRYGLWNTGKGFFLDGYWYRRLEEAESSAHLMNSYATRAVNEGLEVIPS